jgi:pimeloyl-ACP methyl ester carboxylesterase
MDVRSRHNVTVVGRPDGRVVVLAHGFGCDQNMWRLVVPRLAEEFRVVLFDPSDRAAPTRPRGARSATRPSTVTRTT